MVESGKIRSPWNKENPEVWIKLALAKQHESEIVHKQKKGVFHTKVIQWYWNIWWKLFQPSFGKRYFKTMTNPLRYFLRANVPFNNLSHKNWYERKKKKRLNETSKYKWAFEKWHKKRKKSLHNTSLILDKFFHLKKWIEFYRVFQQHICYFAKNKQEEKNRPKPIIQTVFTSGMLY